MSKCEAQTEAEMREADVPWLTTAGELQEYIDSLVDRQHDYGTCVYAMSMAATAAMRYVAKRLGCTGFQASCADMDIIKRSRGLEVFTIVDGEKWLYPQYNPERDIREFREKIKPWLAEKAAEKLSTGNGVASVREHWQRLVDDQPTEEPTP